MKSFISLALLSLGAAVSSATTEWRLPVRCPQTQASLFGNMVVTPTVFKPGDPISIRVDLTCAVQHGINAEFIEYSIEGPVKNNGLVQPVILDRRDISKGALSDAFNTTIPHGFYVAGAAYNVVLTNVYLITGTDGSRVVVKGSVLVPITINGLL